MKKLLGPLFIASALALAIPVLATTTWSEPTNLPSYVRVSKAACTTGTETSHTATAAGLDLAGLKGFVVMAKTCSAFTGSTCSAVGGNMTAGGKLQAWIRNPVTSSWARAPDLDITVTAVAEEAYPGYTVSMPFGTIAFDPNGVGTGVELYIVGR